LSNFQYLYINTCVCFVSFGLWSHHNTLVSSKRSQWASVYGGWLTIFGPMEQKLLNLEWFLSLKIKIYKFGFQPINAFSLYWPFCLAFHITQEIFHLSVLHIFSYKNYKNIFLTIWFFWESHVFRYFKRIFGKCIPEKLEDDHTWINSTRAHY
jgi:hypothetical protein